MRGRKPKPVALRVLHGGAAALADAQYPRPRRVLPRCPKHLSGEAENCWRRLAGELYDAGLLTTVDRDALAAYCTAYARWRRAEDVLASTGEIIATEIRADEEGNRTGGGNLVQSPWLAVANRAQETMMKLAAEFGMTPSARSRVKAEVAAAREARRQPPERNERQAGDGGDDPRRALGAA